MVDIGQIKGARQVAENEIIFRIGYPRLLSSMRSLIKEGNYSARFNVNGQTIIF